MSLEIKRLDKYNFILAERLNEPQIRYIGSKEIIYTHKNIEKYYGNIYSAIVGYFRHLNEPTPEIPKNLKNIKPESDESILGKYLLKDENSLKDVLKNEN